MQSGGDIAATGLEEGTYRMIGSSIKSLTADDYALTFDGSNYSITNQMTKEVRVLTNDEAVQLKNPNMMGGVVHDGLTFQMNTYYGDMKEGELILVQPSRRAAQDISMEMTASEINSIAASDKVNEPGSNVNLLNMISLQTEKMMTAGANGLATTGLQDSYGQLIADIGVQTHYADINRTSQEAILRNAQSSRDNNAAVNLDEEAANLMKYQQMYQASTRIISMADELFKAVLNAV
jgi:flagellar hook-associated protein FlgK